MSVVIDQSTSSCQPTTNMPLKFGEKATVTITSIDKKGRGLGIVESTTGGIPRTARVSFTGPGETVEAIVIKRDGGDYIMKPEKFLKTSEHRITPPCPHAQTCGGCSLQQFNYEHQLELKRGLITKCLEDNNITLPNSPITIHKSPTTFHYRNRMDYGIGPNGELGLKEPGSWNRYVDLSTCLLLSDDAVKVMSAFRAYMKKHNLKPWDNRKYTGYVRYLVIREGKRTGQRMVSIITSAESEPGSGTALPAQEELIAALSPFATTIYHGINATITDLSVTQDMTLLHGAPYLEEKIAGNTYSIHPNAFFQTNTVMAEKLVEKAREYLSAKPPRILLDLYCGTGLFGLSLAPLAERVFGVEIEPTAIDTAKQNAVRNNITNTEFVAGKAEDLALWEQEKPDTVIIDPPRAGLHPKVIKLLLEKEPERIVYVSCNYESFARDWKDLGTKYTVAKIDALDLFPHTAHAEVIALLEKK